MPPWLFTSVRIALGLCSMVGFAAGTVRVPLNGWHLHLPAKLGGTLARLLFGLGRLFGPLCRWAAGRHGTAASEMAR